MYRGGSVDQAIADAGVQYLVVSCSTAELLEWSLEGQGAETTVIRVLAVSLEACFCKPLLPRPLCLLP